MPTEPLGLLLYILFLLPGFAFALTRATHRPVEKRTAFREATSALFVSALCVGILLVITVLIGLSWPAFGSVVREAILQPAQLLEKNFFGAALGLASFLALATVLGALGGARFLDRLWRKLFKVGDSAGSSWHTAFNAVDQAEVIVGVNMSDGAWVQGTLYTFDNSGDDAPDRSLTLTGEIMYRAPGAKHARPLDWETFVVSDRHIRDMTVAYIAKPDEEGTRSTTT